MPSSRVLRTIGAALLATTLVAPAVSAAPSTVADPTPETGRPLAELLAPDGTLRTDTDFAGTVDLAGWSLAGGIMAGAAPRFTRTPGGTAAGARSVRPAAVGDWSALGSNGPGTGAFAQSVLAIAISGTDVYVGGYFTNAAGIAEADKIAKWDGSAWSALGSNGAGVGALNSTVYAIAISGADLYVGGSFMNAAGIPEADYLAKWNGSAWSALGSNGSGGAAMGGDVRAIAAAGNGDIYAAGNFSNAGGVATADGVARWNGTTWSGLGSNGSGDGAVSTMVSAVAVSGTTVYIGGGFTNVAGIATADYVAKWNGSTWSALDRKSTRLNSSH